MGQDGPGRYDGDDASPAVVIKAHVPSWIKDNAMSGFAIFLAAYLVWFVTNPMTDALRGMTTAVRESVDSNTSVIRTLIDHNTATIRNADESHSIGLRILTMETIKCVNAADDAKKREKCVTGQLYLNEPFR